MKHFVAREICNGFVEVLEKGNIFLLKKKKFLISAPAKISWDSQNQALENSVKLIMLFIMKWNVIPRYLLLANLVRSQIQKFLCLYV